MMQGINIFLLFMAAAVTTFAGEDSTAVATIGKSSPHPGKNGVAPPVVTETYRYYEVNGCCEKDLHCDLQQKCFRMQDGKKYDSVTNWKVKWDYGHKRASEACLTDNFVVTVDVVFNLPKWAVTDEAPPALVEKWNSYMEKLILHEQGHRDRAVEAAHELTRAVAELPPSPTCAALDREVQDLFRKGRDRLIKDQETYDEVTVHGVTQGVVFP